MSSDEDEEKVKLYSALERNRKRQMFVAFSSSSSESEQNEFEVVQPTAKRRRKSKSPLKQTSVNTCGVAKCAQPVVELDEDDDDDDDLMTEAERTAEKKRELEIELEIQKRLAKDKLLNQTRAIMNKISVQRKSHEDIISLDSDDNDDDHVLLITPTNSQPTSHEDKGERIMLKIRSNGTAINELVMYMNEPFDILFTNFCHLYGLPRSAVQMSLDGEALKATSTPQMFDLESGDLIDAKVDFSQQSDEHKKNFLRLRLVVYGKRSEVFKIDASSTVEKLHSSFCRKHNIRDTDDVVFSAFGQILQLSERIDYYGFLDSDEISVEIKNYIDPSAIEVMLRYPDGVTEAHHIIPSSKVATLLETISEKKNCPVKNVTLRIDGESMLSTQTFQSYDLEGNELIEVKLQP